MIASSCILFGCRSPSIHTTRVMKKNIDHVIFLVPQLPTEGYYNAKCLAQIQCLSFEICIKSRKRDTSNNHRELQEARSEKRNSVPHSVCKWMSTVIVYVLCMNYYECWKHLDAQNKRKKRQKMVENENRGMSRWKLIYFGVGWCVDAACLMITHARWAESSLKSETKQKRGDSLQLACNSLTSESHM